MNTVIPAQNPKAKLFYKIIGELLVHDIFHTEHTVLKRLHKDHFIEDREMSV